MQYNNERERGIFFSRAPITKSADLVSERTVCSTTPHKEFYLVRNLPSKTSRVDKIAINKITLCLRVLLIEA